MDKNKKKRLEAAGWKVGTIKEFLDLTDEEVQYIEVKYRLSKLLQERRRAKKITQVQLARIIKSSQSRVAKMEAGDTSVSIDLIVRSLFALGASSKSVQRYLPR